MRSKLAQLRQLVQHNAVRTGAFVVSALPLAARADVAAIEAAGTQALSYATAVGGVLIAIWAAKLAYRKFFGS